MKKASEYRAHIEECRVLAKHMQGEQRELILSIASTWEKLAEDRSTLVRRRPEFGIEGEHQEEMQRDAES